VKLLLDTHTALWWVNEYERVSSKAKTMLMDDQHTRYLSMASSWEIAIKVEVAYHNTLTSKDTLAGDAVSADYLRFSIGYVF
jgi:PIN domain nuclease of toxin-antitoxin system